MTDSNHAYEKRRWVTATAEKVTAAILHEHDAKCPICQNGRKPLCPEGYRLWGLWADIRRKIMAETVASEV